MAYFNPQQVSFNPSPSIMQGASAIGDTMQKLYQQNYLEQQDNLKAQQAQRAYDLQSNQFDFQKDRAGVQDTQWADKFAFDKDRFQTENEMKMAEGLRTDMRHQDTVKYQNSALGLQQQTANLAQQKAKDEQLRSFMEGLYVVNQHPELGVSTGAVTQTHTPNDYISRIAGTGGDVTNKYDEQKVRGLSGVFDKVVAKENDPYKVIMASIAGDKATTYKTNEEEKRKLEAERLQETKVKNLKTALYNDPTSVLGIDPSKLTDESRALFFDDINKGLVGKYEVQKRNWRPDQNVYIPYGQTQQSEQQQIKIIPHTEAKKYGITFE